MSRKNMFHIKDFFRSLEHIPVVCSYLHTLQTCASVEKPVTYYLSSDSESFKIYNLLKQVRNLIVYLLT
jgi:hypothetical protein